MTTKLSSMDYSKKLNVLYEDNHLIAVNKPSGYLVQGDKTGDKPLSEIVKEYIKKKYNKPGDVFLGVIHRLDRPVSGVVVFARTTKALTRMNKAFQDKAVKKLYWAVVTERPADLSSTLVHFLQKDHERNVTKAYDRLSNRAKNAKRAELSYDLIGEVAHSHLLAVRPLTGRPHQIRVQLAKIGRPIRDDIKYGYKGKIVTEGAIFLHGRGISFMHPVKKEPIEIFAAMPKNQIWDKFKHIDPSFG